MRATWIFLALAACSGGTGGSDPTTSTGTTPPTVDGCVPTLPEAEVLTVQTRDGVSLEADRYDGVDGAPGVVLLHMIPPFNTREDYPDRFLEQLVCHGWSVVNLDRRGAGGSEGEPVDSYEGPGGAWDVEAAVAAVEEVGAGAIGLVGASNGTTSVLDYTVQAEVEGWTAPSVLVFLSPGTYTENQHPMSDLPTDLPVDIHYGDTNNDDTWPEAQKAGAPASWSFTLHEQGGHGTQLFTTEGKAFRDALDQALLDGLQNR